MVWIIAMSLAFSPVALLRRNLWQLARKHFPALSGKVGLGWHLPSLQAPPPPDGPWGSLQDELRKEEMAAGVRCFGCSGRV